MSQISLQQNSNTLQPMIIQDSESVASSSIVNSPATSPITTVKQLQQQQQLQQHNNHHSPISRVSPPTSSIEETMSPSPSTSKEYHHQINRYTNQPSSFSFRIDALLAGSECYDRKNMDDDRYCDDEKRRNFTASPEDPEISR